MITRHHVALVILCSLILCGVLFPSDPVLILVICLGACIGTILPDIQMKKPQGFQIRNVAWVVSHFSSVICIPLMCWYYNAASVRTTHPRDKRVTHSFPGVLFIWVVLAALIFIPSFILMAHTTQYLTAALLYGVMFGMVLHLIEDMCTRKGIAPFFPFSTTRICGSIRPCDTTDRRIAQFHFHHCSVAVIILGIEFLGKWQCIVSEPICILALGSCLGMMIWSSDVSISRDYTGDRGTEKRTPGLSDQFISQGKADHPS